MKKIGLVLAGGGGRGAYQIGVWKALRETGLENSITSVSGTSVGALNAALFVQNDLDLAQNVWKSISTSKILTSKFHTHHNFARLSLFERDGLEKIIDDNLDIKCFDKSRFHCWMTCVRTDGIEKQNFAHKYVDKNIEYFNLKHIKNNDTRKKIILATSAMPFIFPEEIIEGHKYCDGGTRLRRSDNVPIKPLYEVDKCNIILIVHLDNMDRPVKREKFPNATLFEIFPKENLDSILIADSILDFTAKGAKKRMQQGYNDTRPLFQKMSEIIHLNQEFLCNLKNSYENVMQYYMRKKDLQCQTFELINEYNKLEEDKYENKPWNKYSAGRGNQYPF